MQGAGLARVNQSPMRGACRRRASACGRVAGLAVEEGRPAQELVVEKLVDGRVPNGRIVGFVAEKESLVCRRSLLKRADPHRSSAQIRPIQAAGDRG